MNSITVYPNPFHESTSITFNVNAAQHVSLKIYDLSGREIKTLANRKLQAGEHTFNWQPKGESEGVYYYRLVTDDLNVHQGKMVLIE